ncbi:MAG: hypothetical protein FWF05_07340 [Oscillospiraceae bacterium]|nr:hypothetical protein [Oscillospiraceae bacterium]
MAKLKDIDQKAEEKGSLLVTIWQLVKFTLVSLIAMIVQVVTQNVLFIIPAIKALETTEFHWFVFTYGVDRGGLKYFIAFNVANVLAQIVAFFVNREKTFGGTTNIPITLTIYMIFTVALICFSAWLSPALNGLLLARGVGEQLSLNIAMMVCSALQFFLYFPVDKILMRNKETDKAKKEAKAS